MVFPHGRRLDCGAETGTPDVGPAVDKPVQCRSYPRRKRFGPCAETGSRIRRFGFEASQNRVRCSAESGTERDGLRLRFNGLAARIRFTSS